MRPWGQGAGGFLLSSRITFGSCGHAMMGGWGTSGQEWAGLLQFLLMGSGAALVGEVLSLP